MSTSLIVCETSVFLMNISPNEVEKFSTPSKAKTGIRQSPRGAAWSTGLKYCVDLFQTSKGSPLPPDGRQLLDLQYVIHKKVLELVLTGDGSVHISYSRLKEADTRYARGYGYLKKCLLGLAKDSTNFFQACHQLRDEAARVLYGSTSFSSNATGFREHFTPQQGRSREGFLHPQAHLWRPRVVES